MNQELKTQSGWNWVFRMAWRDSRASAKRLLLFMASIILGIAAVVAIQSFSDNLKKNIALQSKALMGADFLIDSNQPPNERVLAIIDSLGGANAKGVSFPSMGLFPNSGDARLIGVKGVEGAYPLYGELETLPMEAASTYQDRGGALVDATLMLQFNAQVGDSIKIGNVVFPIVGQLISAPGTGGVGASIAPPVWIPYHMIDATGLIQTGSRVGYDFYFLAKEGQDLEALDRIVDPQLDIENADLDTHISTGQRLGRSYDNFGKFSRFYCLATWMCRYCKFSTHSYQRKTSCRGSSKVYRCYSEANFFNLSYTNYRHGISRRSNRSPFWFSSSTNISNYFKRFLAL